MLNSKTLYFYVGSAVSQVVTLLTTLYIIRRFSPSAFGSFSYFVSVGSIVGSLATLKYEQSIAISKNVTEAYDKVNLTFFVSFLINVAVVLTCCPIFVQSNWQNLFWVLMLANTVSFNASLQQLLLYKEAHIYNGLFSVINSTLNYVLLIAVFNNENGLLTASVLSSFITTIVFIIILASKGFKLKLYPLSFYKQIGLSNITYPKYILPGTISTILLTYFHPILLGFIYSKYEVGLFSFSLRILLLPTIVVGSVLSGLFRARLSKLYYNNDFDAIQVQANTVLKWLIGSCILLFPCIIVGIYGMKYFINMNKWLGIEKVSVFLVLYAVSQFFYQPLSNIALVYNKGELLLKLNIIQLSLTLLVYFVVFIFHYSFYYFLNALSAVLFTFTIYACVLFFKIIKDNEQLNDIAVE